MSVFGKIVDQKVGSVTILLLIGLVGVGLLTQSNDNQAAAFGGYACIALFILLALYLVIYNHVREYFEGMLVNERSGTEDLIKNYKDLTREQGKTAILREQATQLGIAGTMAPGGRTYENYREVSSPTNTDE